MRKRKVSLTNKRKVLAAGNDGDKREVVQMRQVVFGTRSGSPARIVSEGRIVAQTMDTSEVARSSYSSVSFTLNLDTNRSDVRKKARLETDERVFTVSEEKEPASVFDEKNEEVDTWQIATNENVDLKEDVRIVVSKNESEEPEDFEQPSVEIPEDSSEMDHLDFEDKVDVESKEEVNRNPKSKMDTKEAGTDILKETIILEENSALNDRLQTEVENEADDTRKEEKKEVNEEDGKDDSSGNNKKGEIHESMKNRTEEYTSDRSSTNNKESKTIESMNKVTEERTRDDANTSNKPETEGGYDPVVNGRKTQNVSEKTRNTNDANKTNTVSVATVNGGDEETTGSESESSRSSVSSGSSSSTSSYSSSSESSSYSESSSGSDSETDSESDSGSASGSRSRSASESSSYSYSTNGSTERKATLRSVVAQTNQSSRQRRRFSQSPSERRTSRDRRYTSRRRSYDRGDYDRDEIMEGDRIKRVDGLRYSRRMSPYDGRGRRDSRSPPRFYRRGSGDRSRSRDRDRLRKSRYARVDERQPRRHLRSRSSKNSGRLSPDSVKNPLLLVDDDYVEIDVKKQSDVGESAVLRMARVTQKKTSSEGRLIPLLIYVHV